MKFTLKLSEVVLASALVTLSGVARADFGSVDSENLRKISYNLRNFDDVESDIARIASSVGFSSETRYLSDSLLAPRSNVKSVFDAFENQDFYFNKILNTVGDVGNSTNNIVDFVRIISLKLDRLNDTLASNFSGNGATNLAPVVNLVVTNLYQSNFDMDTVTNMLVSSSFFNSWYSIRDMKEWYADNPIDFLSAVGPWVWNYYNAYYPVIGFSASRFLPRSLWSQVYNDYMSYVNDDKVETLGEAYFRLYGTAQLTTNTLALYNGWMDFQDDFNGANESIILQNQAHYEKLDELILALTNTPFNSSTVYESSPSGQTVVNNTILRNVDDIGSTMSKSFDSWQADGLNTNEIERTPNNGFKSALDSISDVSQDSSELSQALGKINEIGTSFDDSLSSISSSTADFEIDLNFTSLGGVSVNESINVTSALRTAGVSSSLSPFMSLFEYAFKTIVLVIAFFIVSRKMTSSE